jgi:uncharacterized protein YlxW (UPF0749 family)
MARSRSRRAPLVVAAVVVAVTAIAVVQIRSQVEVARSLAGVDPAALAFQVHDLDTSNAALLTESQQLQQRRDALTAGGGAAADADLQAEAARLRIVDGLAPAEGPGVVITVDAPLTAIDVEDAVNDLRIAGAEAVAINDRRVVTGTVISPAPDAVTVDGVELRGPWRFAAVGDPASLSAAVVDMTRSLRGDPRVRSSAYSAEPDVVIAAVVRPRPFVYGVPS